MEKRRDFLRKAGIATAAITVGSKFFRGSAMGFSAKATIELLVQMTP